MRLGAGNELLQRFVGLLVVYEQQHWIGHQARERNEVGAGDLGGAAEQFVDLGVAGNPCVVREQGIAVGLGGGDELGADLARRAGLGLHHDRLLQDRLHCGRERPRCDVIGAAGRKRIDDADRVRGKNLLRECPCGCERSGGGADHEIPTVHVLPSQSGPKTDQREYSRMWDSGQDRS